MLLLQGPHCTGKSGKIAPKYPSRGKHRKFGNFANTQGKHREFGHFANTQGKKREFGNFAKTQRIWFAQVVNFLILKLQVIAIFATKFSKSISLMKFWRISEISRENFQLDRENIGNL